MRIKLYKFWKPEVLNTEILMGLSLRREVIYDDNQKGITLWIIFWKRGLEIKFY